MFVATLTQHAAMGAFWAHRSFGSKLKGGDEHRGWLDAERFFVDPPSPLVVVTTEKVRFRDKDGVEKDGVASKFELTFKEDQHEVQMDDHVHAHLLRVTKACLDEGGVFKNEPGSATSRQGVEALDALEKAEKKAVEKTPSKPSLVEGGKSKKTG